MNREKVQILENPVDYRRWRLWLEHYLRSLELEMHILTDLTVPSEEKAKTEFLKARSKVIALIYRSVDTKFIDLVAEMSNPKHIIDALDENFQNESFDRVEDLTSRFENLKLSLDINKFFTYVRKLINNYKNSRGTLDDHQLSRLILKAFPDDLNFRPTKIQLEKEAKENNNKYILKNVVSQLESAAKKLKQSRKFYDPRKRFENVAKSKSTFKTERVIICHKCGGRNHMARECRNSKKTSIFCYNCGEDGHKSYECRKRKQEKKAYTAQKTTQERKKEQDIKLWSNRTTFYNEKKIIFV